MKEVYLLREDTNKGIFKCNWKPRGVALTEEDAQKWRSEDIAYRTYLALPVINYTKDNSYAFIESV